MRIFKFPSVTFSRNIRRIKIPYIHIVELVPFSLVVVIILYIRIVVAGLTIAAVNQNPSQNIVEILVRVFLFFYLVLLQVFLLFLIFFFLGSSQINIKKYHNSLLGPFLQIQIIGKLEIVVYFHFHHCVQVKFESFQSHNQIVRQTLDATSFHKNII